MTLAIAGFRYPGNVIDRTTKSLRGRVREDPERAGRSTVNSTPSHPQTCGKIERFWQTLKKWLRAHDARTSVEELNELLAQFRRFYNHDRPPDAFAATVKARPADRPLPTPVLVNRIAVGNTGSVALGRIRVHVGNRWLGHIVHTIRDGDHVVIFGGNRLERELTLVTTRDYQPSASARSQLRGDPEPQPDNHGTLSVSVDLGHHSDLKPAPGTHAACYSVSVDVVVTVCGSGALAIGGNAAGGCFTWNKTCPVNPQARAEVGDFGSCDLRAAVEYSCAAVASRR